MKKTITLILLLSFLSQPLFSGTDWKLGMHKDGIKVFIRDVPGSKNKETRAELLIRTSMASLMSLISDVDNYKHWYPDLKENREIKRISETEGYMYQVVDLPWPAKDRDTILHIKKIKIPESKSIKILINDAKKILPEKPGLIRVNRVKGFWMLTPAKEGFIKMTYQMHTEAGGTIPSWIEDIGVEKRPYEILLKIKKLMEKPEYRGSVCGFKN